MNNNVLMHLSLISHIGPGTIFKIINALCPTAFAVWRSGSTDIDHVHVKSVLLELYNFTPSDFVTQCGLSVATAQKCHDALLDTDLLDQELGLAIKNNVQIAILFDDAYPYLLRQINIPPAVIYYRGQLNWIDPSKSLAIVGSRQATRYSVRVIDHIVPDLIASGWSIVSGGATGVDTFAHEKVLQLGGHTVAVLGCGLLQNNKKIFTDIVARGGAVVSPFPLTFPASQTTFPARNRIIAGLSVGTLVIEAPQESGALITAKYALDENRHVYAVPGPIDDYLSQGSHNLIRSGAMLVSNATQILEDLGYRVEQHEQAIEYENKLPKIIIQENDENADLFRVLDRARPLEDIAQLINCSPQDALDQLFGLQLEGKVSQTFAGLWERQ